MVGAADYVVWRDSLGAIGEPRIPGAGDDGTRLGQADGRVDRFDYHFWKTNFGATAVGSTSVLYTVPGMATGWLFVQMGCAVSGRLLQ